MTKKNKKVALNENNSSEDNSLLIYFKEIQKIPLLKKDEEKKIAILAAQGNEAARERLINSNLRFVISIAKKYQGKGLALQDLISEGNLGLLHAVKNYNVEKGYRFITYAVWWIRQSIIKAIYEKGRLIRLPVNKVNDLIRLNKIRQEANTEKNSDEEIRNTAMYMNLSPEKTNDLMTMNQDAISLEDPVSVGETTATVKDFIEDELSKSPEEHAADSILRKDLIKIVNNLDGRYAEIIRCRYGLGDSAPMTLKEIGERFKLSRERVRQIEKRALIQLQNESRINKLDSYLAS